MSYAAQAYAKTAQTALTPRDLEAHVLLKAAAKLQAIRDGWPEREPELDEALTNNRKLWTVLVSAVTSEESQVPLEIKQNIVNLGLFIFNHTIALMALTTPDPGKLDVLININRQIAAGLRGRGDEGAAA
jgi:flagellar protein FlaF